MSIVSQEPTLFARSVKRNIMYGLEGTDREPSDDDIKEAARLANAASFIEVRQRKPSGKDHQTATRGDKLTRCSLLLRTTLEYAKWLRRKCSNSYSICSLRSALMTDSHVQLDG